MYFSTAGIETAIRVPPLMAFVVSFFTAMGGISGAFLLLPFQMSFLGCLWISTVMCSKLPTFFTRLW